MSAGKTGYRAVDCRSAPCFKQLSNPEMRTPSSAWLGVPQNHLAMQQVLSTR